MLLYYGSNPLYLTQGNYSSYHLATNRVVKEVLKYATNVYVMSKLVHYKYKEKYFDIYGYDHWGNFRIHEEENEDSSYS